MADQYRLIRPFKTSSRAERSLVSLLFKGILKVGIALLLIRIFAEPVLQRLAH